MNDQRADLLSPPRADAADPLVVKDLAWGYAGQPLGSGWSFSLGPGQAAALIGPNGAGKTTLLKTLSGLLPPLAGQLLLCGRAGPELSTRERARLVAVLPQEIGEEEGLTVEELVELGRTPHLDLWGTCRPQDRAAVNRALESCHLQELARRELRELSGGERQRARIALTMAQEAPLLLLDEPASHLDLRRRYELYEQLKVLRHEHHLAVLMVLHDLLDAYGEADRVLVIAAGQIEEVSAQDPQRKEKLARAFGVPPQRIVL